MAINRADGGIELAQMHLLSASNGPVAVPDAVALLNGDYQRILDTLVIEMPDGTSFVIEGYFSQTPPPDLIAPNGIIITGAVAATLAGPSHPGQYAQAAGTAAQGAKPIGQIVTLEGEVTIQRADGTVQKAGARDFVFQNDVILTATGASTSVTFSDGSVLRLSADARLVLDEYVYSPGASSGNKAVFNLISGALGAVSGLVAPSGDMLVKTPSATLAIRGTSVLIEAGSGETKVNMLVDIKDGQGGLVEVVDPATGQVIGSITVANIGQVVSVPAGSGTISVSQLSAAEQATLTSVVTLLSSSYTAAASQPMQTPTGEEGTDGQQGGEEGSEGQGTGEDGAGEGQQPGGGTDGSTGEGTDQEGTAPANDDGQNVQVAVDEASGDGSSPDGSSPPPTSVVNDPTLATSGGSSSGSAPPPSAAPPPPSTSTTTTTQAAPQITLPSAPSVAEDSSGVSVSGFSVTTSSSAPVTVSLSAFSTVTITNTTGLTLISGSFTDAENVVFSGSASNVTNALNSIIYVPTPDNDSTGGFALTVSDGTQASTAVFSVPLAPEPDPPEVDAGIANQQTAEEAAFSFTVPQDAFSDPDSGDSLTLTATLAGGAPLPAWLNFDGTTFSGTPDDPDVGTITVEVTASDTQATTADAVTTFTLQVTPVDDPAVISGDQSGSLLESEDATSGDLNHTDADNPDDAWSTAVVTQGDFGTLTIQTDGQWNYIADAGTFGSLGAGETLTDQVVVATSGGDTAVITITIAGENDSSDITGVSSGAVTEESGVPATGDLDATDPDGPDDTWNTTVVTQGTFGTASINAAGQWSYVLDDSNPTINALSGGDTQVDSFVVATADGTEQTVSIQISGNNDPSVISGDTSGVVTASAAAVVSGDLDHTDEDGPDDAWDPAVLNQGDHGTLVIGVDGVWQYTLDAADPAVIALQAGETLIDTVTVRATDFTEQTVSITIQGASDPSVISGDTSGAATEDSGLPATGDLNAVDPDGPDDAWNTTVVNQGSFGTLTIGTDGQWSYALDDGNATVDALVGGDTLSDSVTVQTADGTQQVITISITGANDAAVISGDFAGSLDEDETNSITGDLDHTDVDGLDDEWNELPLADATYGNAEIGPDGQWSYTLDPGVNPVDFLDAGQTLIDTFTVETSDGTQADVNITITGVNDAAVISGDISGTVAEDSATPATGDLDHTDADSGDADDAWDTSVVSQGSFGTLTIGTDGQWSYVLDDANATVDALNVGGTLTDTVTVATADATEQDIVITINGANDPAVITGPTTGAVTEDGGSPATGNLNHTDVDNANDSWSTSVVSQGAFGNLTINGFGAWVYTLNDANASVDGLNTGVTLIDTVTVATGDGTEQDITITINGANDAATISGDITGSATEDSGAPATGDLDSLDPDNDNDTWNTNVVTQGQYGVLTLTVAGLWSYALNDANAAVDALAAGETLTDTVTVATVDGTQQNITITIQGADDAITGTSGDDVLNGTPDNDIIVPLTATDNPGDLINASAGDDSIQFTNAVPGQFTLDYSALGVAINAQITGASGTVTKGALGTDTLVDVDDIQTPGGGLSLIGGALDDVFDVDPGTTGFMSIRPGGGQDIVNNLGTTQFLRIDLTGYQGALVTGGMAYDLGAAFSNPSTVTVNGGVDEWKGTAFDDWIESSAGIVNLLGEGGNDILIGHSGAEQILAGLGNDIIIGGGGNENLLGQGGADIFVHSPGDGSDTIQDFSVAEGDKIYVYWHFDVVTHTNLSRFELVGGNTEIEFSTGEVLTVVGVDLTSLPNPDDAFDFDTNIEFGTTGNDELSGTPENDIYLPGRSDPNIGDYLEASYGDDTYNFTGTYDGFTVLSYRTFDETDINVTITGATGTIEKGADPLGNPPSEGTDTLVNLDAFRADTPGGFRIDGAYYSTSNFDVDTSAVNWLALRLGQAVNTLDHSGTGTLRVEFRNWEGVILNGSTGIATEASGGGASLDFSGTTVPVNEWRGSNFDDTLSGGAADERFITERGNDTIDGGGGVNLLRYDRYFFDGFGGVTGVTAEYTAQGAGTVSGIWYGQTFTDTFTNIQQVRGSNVGIDKFAGAAGDETFDGRGGANFFYGGGGSDTLKAGGERNLFQVGDDAGTSTIENFVVGRDKIAFDDTLGLSGPTFNSFTLIGTDTVIDIDGVNTVIVKGVDLTGVASAAVFTFNTILGTNGDDRDASALNGTAGNDIILGDDGDDQLFGGDGDDVLSAGGSNLDSFGPGDFLDGGAGDDWLFASQGNAVLRGGQGNDVLSFAAENAGNPFLSDVDWAWADYRDAPSGIVVNFTNSPIGGLAFGQVADGFGTVDIVDGVHVIVDSAHNDQFFVDGTWQNSFGNFLEVRLSGGDDTVEFTNMSGTARVSWQLAQDGVIADLATGTATDANLDNGDQIGNDVFLNANYLRGSNHADTLLGDSGDNRFRGSGGDDYIDGDSGNDRVDHNDSLGGVIADLSQNTVFNDGKGGFDTLISIENINGGYGDDIISGDDFANGIGGTFGNDVLMGGGGDDWIQGDWGSINGFAGGDDILIGGDGFDTLIGGDGADTFVILPEVSPTPVIDDIQDFNFSQGDRIDVRAFGGISSTADFLGAITYNSTFNNTFINIDGVAQVRLQGVDLVSELGGSIDSAFIFDGSSYKEIGTQDDDTIVGTAGNDFLAPGNASSETGDVIIGTAGDDKIEFLGTINGFYTLNYSNGSVGPIDVFMTPTVALVDKGTLNPITFLPDNGTDTLLNTDMINGNEGGLWIRGSQHDDTFTVDPTSVGWLAIRGGADGGTDTITRTGTDGILRVDVRDWEGATIDAAAGTVTERFQTGAQSQLNVTGFVDEWRGSLHDDIFTGSSGDDRFITETGNDQVDGGAGTDAVRYNRSGVANLTVVYSSPTAATITGVWFAASFVDSLLSVEHVIGSNLGVDLFRGAGGNEILDGRGGAGLFDGGAGDDLFKASAGQDLFIIGPGDGNDTIRGFMQGEDVIDLSLLALPGTTYSVSYTFDGSDTIIDFGGGHTLTVEDANLTNDPLADHFVLTRIEGTTGDETINGTAANERINAGAGNDVVNAGAGNDIVFSGGSTLDFNGWDVLNGEDGDDVLIAEGGGALLRGGPGNDILVGTNEFGDPEWDFVNAAFDDAPSAITANLTDGDSNAVTGLDPFTVNDGHGSIDTIGSGVSVVRDSAHNDVFYVDGSFNDAFAEIRLSAGNDTVVFLDSFGGRRISYKNANDGVDANLATGTAVDNNLGNGDQIGTDSFTGANQLRGSDFDDVLTGNADYNRFRGSGGDDYIVGGGGNNRIDHYDSPNGINVNLSLSTGQVIDDGFGSTDTVVGVRDVAGSYFDDTIIGDSADNVLIGHHGADTLNGGNGNDTLIGGLGADGLTGNAGADTFVIDAVYPVRDVVTDYNILEGDVVDLSAILDDAFTPANADTFVTATATTNGAEVSVDTNQSTGQDFVHVVTLTGMTTGATFNFIYDDNNNVTSVTVA